jgi:inner membrane protein
MDNVTHTLAGLALAGAGLSRRCGRGTALTLAVASNLPDVDAALALLGRWDYFLDRRTVTHSAAGIPFLALAAAWTLRRLYPEMRLGVLFGLNVLGMSLHVAMDLLNSYGVCPLHPIDGTRYELAWVFIVDLVMLALLALPWLVRRLPARDPGRADEARFRAALAATLLYVALCGIAHRRAGMLLADHLRSAGRGRSPPDSAYVFPEALGCHRFRAAVHRGRDVSLYLVHVVSGRVELKREFGCDAGSPEVEAVRASPTGRRLAGFFKAPVWTAARDAAGAVHVSVFDLRFVSTVLPDLGRTLFRFEFVVSRGSIVGPGDR